MRIRSAVLREMGLAQPYATSRPLEIVELELDDPGPGEVLLRVRAAGLCHSDLSVINGSRPRVMPMALGHEAAGEVVACGEGVTRVQPGDHAVMVFVPSCGECDPCLAGRAALCEPARRQRRGHAAQRRPPPARPRRHRGAAPPGRLGLLRPRRVRAGVGRGSTRRCPSRSPPCSVRRHHRGRRRLHAATSRRGTAWPSSGSAVGLRLLGARLAGAEVIGSTSWNQAGAGPRPRGVRHRARRPRLRGEYGATDGGANVAIETAGPEFVLADAYAATRRGGTTVTGGLPDPSKQLSIPAVSLVAEERTLRGSYLGSGVPAHDVPRMIELYLDGRLPVDRLLSDTLPLEDINEGFDRLASGEAIRQAIVF